MKHKLINIGISDVHHSVLHFLLLMSNNPTQQRDEIPNFNKKYLSKEEMERLYDEKIEEELK